ncbi:MAG: TRAP transporter small permease subunit [Synergistales bacterium]|nr:TRAP transporter small permease subunit [Synergistales bacterium]
MRGLFKWIDIINEKIGKIFSLLILAMIAMLCYEVIMRYMFDSPTIWVHEISAHIFGMYAVLGGGFVLLHRDHIKSDVLYAQFSPRVQAIFDVITFPFFFILMGIIFVEGFKMAATSISVGETTVSFLRSPVYPVKTCIPIAAFLMIMQGIPQFGRSLKRALHGEA